MCTVVAGSVMDILGKHSANGPQSASADAQSGSSSTKGIFPSVAVVSADAGGGRFCFLHGLQALWLLDLCHTSGD